MVWRLFVVSGASICLAAGYDAWETPLSSAGDDHLNCPSVQKGSQEAVSCAVPGVNRKPSQSLMQTKTPESMAFKPSKTVPVASAAGAGATGLLLTEVQDLIAMKGKTGMDVLEKAHMDDIHDLISNSVTPSIFEGIQEMLEELEGLYQAVLDCQVEVSTNLDNVIKIEEGIETWTKSHWECRTYEEVVFKEKKEVCEDFEIFTKGIALPEGLPDDIAATDDETIAHWLSLMGDYLCPIDEIYHKKWKECENKTTILTETREKCTLIQEEFEEAFCTVRQELTITCETYDSCWDESVQRYNERKAEIMKVLQERQEEYVAANKIECLIDSIEGDNPCYANETKVEECWELPVNLTNLTIPFPKLPDPIECDIEPVKEYPCTEGWIRDQYQVWGLDQEIFKEIAATCKYCEDSEVGTPAPQSEWDLHHISRSALELFTKDSGSAAGWDSSAYSKYAEVWSITIEIKRTDSKFIFGLTTETGGAGDMSPSYLNSGYFIELLPDGELHIVGGESTAYRKGEFITMKIQDLVLSVIHGSRTIHTWDVSQPSMYAAMHIFDMGAAVQISDYQKVDTPVRYDMENGAKVWTCATLCDRYASSGLTPAETTLKESCEMATGEVTLCGCVQVQCSIFPF